MPLALAKQWQNTAHACTEVAFGGDSCRQKDGSWRSLTLAKRWWLKAADANKEVSAATSVWASKDVVVRSSHASKEAAAGNPSHWQRDEGSSPGRQVDGPHGRQWRMVKEGLAES